MTFRIDNPLACARLAGVLYLVIIVLGIWSEVAVRMTLVVPDDAAATAANILANQSLFRLSFAADTVMALADVGLAVLLFVLLRPAGATLALAAMVFRLIQASVIAANLMSQHGALLLLDGSGLAPETAEALALLAVRSHAAGYDLGLVFFGVNSLLTGALLYRSGYFPRLLGVAIALAGLVYLAGSTIAFLAPGLGETFAPAYLVTVLAETAFALWLLIRGLNAEKWRAAAG